MSTRIVAGLVALAALLPTAAAHADAYGYRGPHPSDLDGHWHLEEAVHVHGDLPMGLEPFGEVDGVRVFLADPLAWGYTGEVWTYRGAHPLPAGSLAYCGLTGEHRHVFAPEGTYRREARGEYVFTGAMRGGIALVRPARTAPRHPLAPAPLASGTPATAVIAPFWLSGCLHTTLMGPDGRLRAVPLDGCEPRHVRREPPPRRAPPPPSALDGRYTQTWSPPGVMRLGPTGVRQPRDR